MKGSVSILLLEDNPQMRTLLTVILDSFGFKTVHGANSIPDAMNRCAHHQYDLILVDQLLAKGVTGLDFVRWMRMSPESTHTMVPVIAVSSYSERRSILEAINAGVDEFLVKPLAPKDLAARITAVTKKRRQYVRTTDYFGPCRRRQVLSNYRGPQRRCDDPENVGKSEVLEL